MQHVKSIILHFENEEKETQIELKNIKSAKIYDVTQIFRAKRISENEDPILLQDLMSTRGTILFKDVDAHNRMSEVNLIDFELSRIDLVSEEVTSFVVPEDALLSLEFVGNDLSTLLSYRCE